MFLVVSNVLSFLQALTELADRFQKELTERRKYMSEEELDAFMADYRRQQKALLDKRRHEKNRTDDLLAQKLAERNRKKNGQEVIEI